MNEKKLTLHLRMRLLVFLTIFVPLHVAATAEEFRAPFPRFEPMGVVLSYKGLRYCPHNDVITVHGEPLIYI